MAKIDIKEHIKTKAIADGLKVLGCIWNEQALPTMRECEAYKTLLDYFQNATYSIKSGQKKSELNIRHKKYSTLKFAEDQGCWFNQFAIIYKKDTLEAKVVLDIPVLDKEFKIIATRKNNNNYICNTLSYDGNVVYNKL